MHDERRPGEGRGAAGPATEAAEAAERAAADRFALWALWAAYSEGSLAAQRVIIMEAADHHPAADSRGERTMEQRSVAGALAAPIRWAIAFAALVNLVIGGAFLIGPELGLQLWPTPVAPILMRFIGAIVLGNGVGAALIARDGSWARAQALMLVALVYGAIILAALLYHLLVLRTAPPIFWGYVLVDALFLAPIAAVYRHYAAAERGEGRRAGRPARAA